MSLIVQKYGGTSVGNPQRILNVARRVVATQEAGHRVVVVVSAMSGVTDNLINLARQVSQNPSEREMDVILSTGEERLDLGHNIAVSRRRLHRRGRALHVHQRDRSATCGGEREHARLAASVDIVDEARASVERGGGNARLRGVDGNHHAFAERGGIEPRTQRGDDADDPADLFVDGDGLRTRASGLAADIDDVGTVGNSWSQSCWVTRRRAAAGDKNEACLALLAIFTADANDSAAAEPAKPPTSGASCEANRR